MALYAFDGTWNEAKTTEDLTYTNTNVARFYQAYHRHSNTDDLYVPGVGTRFDVIGRVLGGAFGLGELPRINQAYDHLCRNWAAGDRAIDIVGFSRGAATTLDFCHCLQQRGVRRPGTDEVVEPKPQIRFLGLWDVVGAFGLANLGNVELNIGHHLVLPKSNLRYCFHALALDERRPSFLPTRLNGACEVWFRGAHSDIGGGNGRKGLNDITLKWMFNKAIGAQLPMTSDDVSALSPNPAERPNPDHKLPLEIRAISAVDRCHFTVSALDGWANPPATCSVESEADERVATELGEKGIEVLPLDVRRRVAAMYEKAQDVARGEGFTLDHIHDALLTLITGRVPLVTNDADLVRARAGVARLMAATIQGARRRGFHVLAEFFLNEALFNMPHLYPLTD